jgi:thiosulfate dehydrogenase
MTYTLRLKTTVALGFLLLLSTIISCQMSGNADKPKQKVVATDDSLFVPPDTSTIPHDEYGDMVRYGRKLVVNTSYYLGPNGTVGHYLNNKMNCGNCHLDAGTRPYGLNYFSSHARYPQYRGRENRILTLAERVNNCIERPHHGKPMPLDSKEMVAMVSYMRWLSAGVPTGKHVKGDAGVELVFPNRAADPAKGAMVFAENCARCHGADGQGQYTPDSSGYIYPPLWGPWGYEGGSSMHRVLKAARFIKANMPHNIATWKKPVLTDEQAIDVAAFINDDRIHDRPRMHNARGYENEMNKPIDYDTPPFPDGFSAEQHKFGPYQPIIDYHKEHNLPVIF